MKTSFYVECKNCRKGNHINYALTDTEVSAVCECGNRDLYSLDSSFTIGQRILEKSTYEFLENKDYDLSIVFSAMAFECELTGLYFRWGNIDNKISDRKMEENLRKFGDIKNKIDKVSKIMFREGFQKFIENNKDRFNIKNDFPSLNNNNMAKSFQEQLFWPRNKVLHHGFSGHTKENAKECFNITILGLQILDDLDRYKSNLQSAAQLK